MRNDNSSSFSTTYEVLNKKQSKILLCSYIKLTKKENSGYTQLMHTQYYTLLENSA